MHPPLERLKRSAKSALLTLKTPFAAAGGGIDVVYLGDSRAKAWPTPSNSRAIRCGNRGIGFDTTSNMLRRMEHQVRPLRPRVVGVQAGVNDFFAVVQGRADADDAVERVVASLEHAARRLALWEARVVLTTLFPVAEAGAIWGSSSTSVRDLVLQCVQNVNELLLATQLPDCLLFDCSAVLASRVGYVRPDYAQDALHLSAAGYRALNHALGPLIDRALHGDILLENGERS